MKVSLFRFRRHVHFFSFFSYTQIRWWHWHWRVCDVDDGVVVRREQSEEEKKTPRACFEYRRCGKIIHLQLTETSAWDGGSKRWASYERHPAAVMTTQWDGKKEQLHNVINWFFLLSHNIAYYFLFLHTSILRLCFFDVSSQPASASQFTDLFTFLAWCVSFSFLFFYLFPSTQHTAPSHTRQFTFHVQLTLIVPSPWAPFGS